MKRFVLKMAIFALPLWAGSYLLTSLLDSFLRENRTQKQLWSMAQHDRSVDYVVAGSSRAFHNIDVATLEKVTGGKAINLGYDAQSIAEMYLTLNLFFGHQNRARHLVLQLDGWDLSYFHKFQGYLYLPYANKEAVSSTLRDFGLPQHNVLGRTLPLLKYAEYNEFYMRAFLRQARSNHSMYDDSAGSELLFDESYHVFPEGARQPDCVIDARARHYLDLIVELAKSREIGLTIFSAPIYQPGPAASEPGLDSRAYIASYCRDRGISYVDFTDAAFDRSEFRDFNHLNGPGALRLTSMLAERLSPPETKSTATPNLQIPIRDSL